MEILKAKGYTGLVDLDGGIMAWIAAGGTVVPGESALFFFKMAFICPTCRLCALSSFRP
jgi:hypothetical protein